jgi:uncharacterized MAPEG superfamily protein
MPTDLKMLAWSVALGLVYIVTATIAKRRQDGLKWAAGNREVAKTYTGAAGRLDRAEKNFMETFPFFAAAVLVSHFVNGTLVESSPSTLAWWGPQLYFWSRVAYLPVYGFGITKVRSILWGVSFIGIILVLVGLT